MHDRRLHILAFEPFDTGSHRQVRESISRHSRHEWRWFTRPGRAWKWRMRLAAFELAQEVRTAEATQVDLIFATSLMSVADLVAALPASLRHRPVVVYMHENQVAYPPGRGGVDDRDVHFALTNLASILVADHTIWNSAWNRQSFEDGLSDLLIHAPDCELDKPLEVALAGSEVIWPPVEPPPMPTPRQGAPGPRVVWPHRWEHDKGPDELLELARSTPRDLTWTILGRRYREIPDALVRFQREHAQLIDHFAPAETREEYWTHLARCDWVLSTARHEFFGVAVVEAMLAGCLPWLPARLSYPELLPPCAHALSPMRPPSDPDAVRVAVRAHLDPAVAPNAVAHLDETLTGVVVRFERSG